MISVLTFIFFNDRTECHFCYFAYGMVWLFSLFSLSLTFFFFFGFFFSVRSLSPFARVQFQKRAFKRQNGWYVCGTPERQKKTSSERERAQYTMEWIHIDLNGWDHHFSLLLDFSKNYTHIMHIEMELTYGKKCFFICHVFNSEKKNENWAERA